MDFIKINEDWNSNRQLPIERVPVNELKSIYKKYRVKKEDSAFVYFILESHEGIASYSTVNYLPGSPYRDLELRIPPDFLQEVNELMQQQLGDLTYEIE